MVFLFVIYFIGGGSRTHSCDSLPNVPPKMKKRRTPHIKYSHIVNQPTNKTQKPTKRDQKDTHTQKQLLLKHWSIRQEHTLSHNIPQPTNIIYQHIIRTHKTLYTPNKQNNSTTVQQNQKQKDINTHTHTHKQTNTHTQTTKNDNNNDNNNNQGQ